MADDPEQPPEGRGRGRPRVALSYEQEVQLEALAAFLTLQQIADFFGIGRSTLAQMMADNPDLRARYDKGIATAIAEVGEKLMDKIRKGDSASIFFFLKTRAGWRETNRLEHTVPPEAKSLADFYADLAGPADPQSGA